MMHLVNTGYKFKGCCIFLETGKAGLTRQFRDMLHREIIQPRKIPLAFNTHDLDPWQDPLESH